jgi:hypothetical protein
MKLRSTIGIQNVFETEPHSLTSSYEFFLCPTSEEKDWALGDTRKSALDSNR